MRHLIAVPSISLMALLILTSCGGTNGGPAPGSGVDAGVEVDSGGVGDSGVSDGGVMDVGGADGSSAEDADAGDDDAGSEDADSEPQAGRAPIMLAPPVARGFASNVVGVDRGGMLSIYTGNIADCRGPSDQWSAICQAPPEFRTNGFTSVAIDLTALCAIDDGNRVQCFQRSGFGPDLETPDDLLARSVSFFGSTSETLTACALGIDDTVTCWGVLSRETGQGEEPILSGRPYDDERFQIFERCNAVSGGGEFCAVNKDGLLTISRAGGMPGSPLQHFFSVELGDVSVVDVVASFATVSSGERARVVCALLEEGAVRCFSSDGEEAGLVPDDLPPLDELTLMYGDGSFSNNYKGFVGRSGSDVVWWGCGDNPTMVSDPSCEYAYPFNSSVVSVVGGQSSPCAITADGCIECWGGELADDIAREEMVRRGLPAGDRRAAIEAEFTCANPDQLCGRLCTF